MSPAQNTRCKVAIRTVLEQIGPATYGDISLRAGEGLASPLMEMVQSGEVVKTMAPDAPSIYALKA